MSMLAEPRRKQKWSLNPRGKEWSEDSNKFGQKMLEKMGWTNGKGLGANEQGITEHVRVSFKNDTAGIGFKKDSINEAWTEHQDNFNDFLQKLQQNEINNAQTEENKNVLSGKSLELKSKQSRARVHYQKFTRGKDINKYSAKDLANIFGQKELNINNNNNKDDNSSVGIQENRNGVITINGGNMTEYFMKKGQDFSLMQNKHKKHQKNKEESEYPGFGFESALKKVQSHESKEIQNDCNYVFDNPCIQLNSENISNFNNEIEFSKKRKSNNIELNLSDKVKKFKENNINEKICTNGIVNAGLNLEYQDNEIHNGKEFEVSRVQFGVTNSALDLSDEINKKRVTFNDHVEYSTDCIKKKKNRTTLDKFEVENKKVKKKKKHDVITDNSILSGFVNEALDVVETTEEVHDNEVNERKSKKSKKRNRQSNLETIVEIEEEKACEDEIKIKHIKIKDNTLDNSIDQDVPNKKKKKKKDKEKIEIHVENKYDEKIEKKIISEINTLEKECEIHEDQKDTIKKKKKKTKDKVKSIEPNIEKEENTNPIIKSEAKTLENIEEKNKKLETIQVKNKRLKEDDGINDLNSKMIKKDQKKIANKENTENTENTNENETNKSEKKKHKKLVNEYVNNKNFNSIEFEKKTVKQRNIIHNRNTQSKTFNNRTFNTSSSPWNQKAKMSKRLLISLFNKNSTVDFPGSNMHDIKGYGADIH